eukprot:Amastigsp_a96_3797.p1 type:complete len:639 gc:universal Amastigsp_a96_3797:43-1959(+)
MAAESGPSNGDNICIGIDLGTTYSCVGVWKNDRVDIISNESGERTTPSCVAFTEEGRLVGKAAANQAGMNPENTIFDAKRLIGRLIDDAAIQADMKHWPFAVVANAEHKPLIRVHAGTEKQQDLTPEEVSSMVLIYMKQTAEAYLGHEVKKAVITVPAYFSDSQRRATQDAGRIAGLEVMRIINEPTAAAIAYGLDQRGQGARNVLIFDLGGGTFDVSILTIQDGIFSVVSTAGNTHLGGEDFDNNLVAYCVEQFNKKHSRNVSESRRALRRLRTACERAKRQLSTTTSAEIEVESLIDGIDLKVRISRAKFEEMNAELFASCLQPVEQVLTDAKMAKKDINDVVLVGGSTRIPKVQELLREFFGGKELNQSINPDEAVAYGAAVQAAILTGQAGESTKDFLLLDVTPLSLGVDTIGGFMSVIIPRNTKIPCRKQDNFTTVEDGQREIDFAIYEGERVHVDGNNKLGEFTLRGIPAMKRGEAKVTVTMAIDANGILTVSAEDNDTKSTAEVVIANAAGRLSQTEIDRMIQEAQRNKDIDNAIRARQRARNELEQYCYGLRDEMERMENEGLTIAEEEKDAVEEAIAAAIDWMDEAGAEATPEGFADQKKEVETAFQPLLSRALKEKRRQLKNQRTGRK